MSNKSNTKNQLEETEIGLIPEDWENLDLGDIAEFKNGKSSPERATHFEFPVYGANGIIGNSEKTNSNVNTIIIGRVGAYCGSLNFSETRCWVTDNAIVGKAKDNSDGLFLYYLLKTLNLNNRQGGSGQPLLNQALLNSIRIRCPKNKREQQKISAVLGVLDEKIELNRKMNKTLESIGQAIFNQWFVKFEFPNNEGGPYKSTEGLMISSEFGKIPEGWKVSSIYDIANVKYGAPFSSKLFNREKAGHPLIRIRDLKTLKPEFYTTEDHSKGFFVVPGDVIVGMDAEFTPWIWLGKKSLVNQRVCVFVPKHSYIHSYFIYQIIKPRLEYFEKGKVGTTVIHLGKADIDTFKIIEPTSEILEKYKNIIEPMVHQIICNSKEIETLSQIRDSLLPRLMSGKLRVK